MTSEIKELQSTPLVIAAGRGHKACVETLIELGADVNKTGSNGSTALMNTVDGFQNDTECARLLIKLRANVNAADTRGETALIKAAIKVHVSMIELLLESGADVNVANQKGSTALMMASSLKDGMHIVKVLVDSGANVNEKDIKGKSPLMIASIKCNLPTIETLINFGADVNDSEKLGFTSLLWAVSRGHMFCIEELANCYRGKGALFPHSVGNHQDRAAFMYNEKFKLCEKIRIDNACLQSCVRLLLASGADVNHMTRNSGWTALMVAALDGDTKILKLLLESGADVNAVAERNGWSALVSAVVGDHSECVQLLIQSGADVNIVISPVQLLIPEMSVLGFAVDIGNREVIKLFLQGGVHIGGVWPTAVPGYNVHKILEVAGVYPLEDPDTSLQGQCREVIRKQLLHVRPPVNIYLKTKRLGLPSRLQRYLLYNVTLD